VRNGSIIDLYQRHADAYDAERSRTLQERAWLDRFLDDVHPGNAAHAVDHVALHLLDAVTGLILHQGGHDLPGRRVR
jgi:hypothetical protein